VKLLLHHRVFTSYFIEYLYIIPAITHGLITPVFETEKTFFYCLQIKKNATKNAGVNEIM